MAMTQPGNTTTAAGRPLAGIERLSDLLASRAGYTGDCIVDQRETLSWDELAQRSRAVAAGFAELGVGLGDRVAVWLPNRAAWLVSFLACAQLGAITVSINTRFRSAEIGDLLYAVTNLARHFDIDAESSLRQTIRRFESRFRIVEQLLAAEGKIPEQTPLDELEAKWQQAKQQLASGLECSKSAIKNGHD